MEARPRVSNAQQSGDMNALGSAEGMLRMGLGNLFAVAEGYPELKANRNLSTPARKNFRLRKFDC